ncbi:MAG TPA: hypothetical protein VIS06_12225, partial [Mycobacteriales bacterium]
GQPAEIVEVAGETAGVLADRIVLAHRSHQVRGLLGTALPGWTPARVLGTRRLAGLVWPSVRSRALVELTRRVGLTVRGQVGRAGWDAQATALLFTVMARGAKLPPQRATQHHAPSGGTPEPGLCPGEGLESIV